MAKFILEIEVMPNPPLYSLAARAKNLSTEDVLLQALELLGHGRPGLVRARVESMTDSSDLFAPPHPRHMKG